MKRICAALLAVLLAFSCLAVTAFADGTEGGRMYGDVNGDGKINLRDVILVIRVRSNMTKRSIVRWRT